METLPTRSSFLIRRVPGAVVLQSIVGVIASNDGIYFFCFSDQRTSSLRPGQGVIVNGVTNQLADGSAPVTGGDTVVIYCTGLGAVNPPVALGAAASGPTPTVQPVVVTIGGQPATVGYAGLTPGFPGLYQVNAVVPAGIAPSGQVPVVLSTAEQDSPAVTIAVR